MVVEMSSLVRADALGDAPGVSRQRSLPLPRRWGLNPHWPIWVAVPGLVVFWALGLGFAARLAVILPLALRLFMQPRVRIPPRLGIFLLFVAWTFLTSLQLPPRGMAQFMVLRGSEYIAIVLGVLHVYNIGPRGEGVEWLRRAFLWAWLGLVGLGLVAVAIPNGELPSVARMILPGDLANQPFIQQLTTPSLAQVQPFLGFALPRPSAPFAYSNGWGSAFALLLPFVIASAVTGSGRDRRLARVGLFVSIIPAVMSVNRAMWGSVILILGYLVLTTREPVLRLNLRRAALAMLLILAMASFSPLGNLVADRLSTPHSNNARQDLAVAAGERLLEHPFIGFGGPLEYEGPGIRPPVGTQGHLWLMLISNGIPALLLYLGYFGATFPLLRGPRMGNWTRAAIIAMFLQLPFYGLLGGQLLIVMLAIAGSQRELLDAPLRPRKRSSRAQLPASSPSEAPVSARLPTP